MPISCKLPVMLMLALAILGPRELAGQQIQRTGFAAQEAIAVSRSFGPIRLPHATTRVDTASHSHRRATIIGAVVGAVVGGLGGAAIGINQNAYECVATIPSCPRKPDRTLLYSSAGVVAGGALGAWTGHSLVSVGR
jgi:hypothetical protein